MRDFFSLDGPFNKYGGMVADMIILSFMWLLFSIPLVTIGASTTAMFYVSTRRIANREGYITRDFWEAFKANFKKATIIWLICIVLAWLIWFNLSNIDVVGSMGVIIYPAQIIIIVEMALMAVYIFPMTARFDMSIKQIFKSCFYMANRHLLTSVTCVILVVAIVLSFIIMPPLTLFLGPGLYAWMASHMVIRLFKRYRPEMDKDPILEIQEIEAQKEEERRQRRIGAAKKNGEEMTAEDYIFEETEEAIPGTTKANENDESENIWEKLRNVDIEELEPTPEPIIETAEDRRNRALDSIFEDEDDEPVEKVDIWAQLRNASEDENEN